jgi:hypothetical protein
MKKIPTKLVCYTSSGYTCYRGIKGLKNEAISTARRLIDEGYAFSYKIQKLY